MMAGVVEEKEGEKFDRYVVYKIQSNIDDELIYVGVGVADITNIFQVLHLKKVKAILHYPKELAAMKNFYEYNFTFLHVMSDDTNTADNACEIAHLISKSLLPTHPMRNSDLKSFYGDLRFEDWELPEWADELEKLNLVFSEIAR